MIERKVKYEGRKFIGLDRGGYPKYEGEWRSGVLLQFTHDSNYHRDYGLVLMPDGDFESVPLEDLQLLEAD
jgi:hypothetical protein